MTIQPIKQVKLPISVQPSSRDKTANKDDYMINGYMEKLVDDGVQVFKRPCFTAAYTTPGTPMGMHYSNFGAAAGPAWVTSNTLYIDGVSVGGVPAIGTNTRITFADYGGGTPGFFMNHAVTAGSGTCSFYNGSINTVGTGIGVTQGGIAMGTAYLDGTLYLMSGHGGIYGSNINDPTTWGPATGNLIQATADAQTAYYLAKQKVYIIAFMQFSVQVFFDNQNPTGSPLAPLPGGYAAVGCADPWSVVTMGDEIMWVGQAASGGLGVYLMRDLHITKVSTGAVDRILALGYNGQFTKWFTAWWSGAPGHRFYIVNLPTQNFSLVYDLENGMWYEWATAGNVVMPYTDSAISPKFIYASQHSNGNIYNADIGTYQDFDGIPTFTLVTEPWDGGSRYKKTIPRIDFLADQVANSTLSVSYTEDDYQTYSNVRTVDLSMKRPNLTNCGTTRRRAYKLVHNANTSLRLEDLLISVQEGNL